MQRRRETEARLAKRSKGPAHSRAEAPALGQSAGLGVGRTQWKQTPAQTDVLTRKKRHAETVLRNSTGLSAVQRNSAQGGTCRGRQNPGEGEVREGPPPSRLLGCHASKDFTVLWISSHLLFSHPQGTLALLITLHPPGGAVQLWRPSVSPYSETHTHRCGDAQGSR